jgi:type I restriction enzyme S subunit
MQIDKSKWETMRFKEVAKKITRRIDPFSYGIERIVAGENIESEDLKIRTWGIVGKDSLGPAFHILFMPGDILYGSRRTYLKKVALADFEGVCANTTFVIRANENLLLQDLLKYIMLSERFTKFSVGVSKGSTNPYINWKDLDNFTFQVPSLPEQRQIINLFQNLENCIEQAEQQEKNLKVLLKYLVNNLTQVQPKFGNLLNAKNCKSVLFGEVSDCVEKHDKQKDGIEHVIGLENIVPEDFKISTWSDIDKGTTFTKRFCKGDVLFGKRRSYLKKVAIAEFDGVCSGDILVFRANEKEILPELLPFYVSSEKFIEYAVSTSAGSLSPRTKWKDLSNFSFQIPNLETQKKIVKVLDLINNTIEQLKSQQALLKQLKNKLLNEIL